MSYKKCQASRLAFLFLVTLIGPMCSKGMPNGRAAFQLQKGTRSVPGCIPLLRVGTIMCPE